MSNQNNEQRKSKRKTLKAILGGTGAVAGSQVMPEKWMKPIVSTVILPVHAGSSPSGNFECNINEIEFNRPSSTLDNIQFFAEVQTEAPSGTPVDGIIRNPGIEFNGSNEIDLIFTSPVESGTAFFESGFTNESTSPIELTVDFDIDQNSEIDCSQEADLPAKTPPIGP